MVDGQDAVKDVWEVLDKIKTFTDKVRDGKWVGVTGKPLVNVVAIGIGGSFLGPLFVHTALRSVLDPISSVSLQVMLFYPPEDTLLIRTF